MIERKMQLLIFCCLMFMGSLIVADFTSVKLGSISLGSWELLIPMGTFAFAITFWCTDIISELYGRTHAITIVWTGMAIRVFLMIYVSWVIGDKSGEVIGLNLPEFWSAENQRAVVFVFTQSINIFIAGFAAILVASVLDVYVFHYLKDRHEGRNLFWLRNNVSTFGGQLINSTLFVVIAFRSVLTPGQLLGAVVGQVIVKWIIALFIDTPLAYLLRNYGQDKDNWYAFWTKSFWAG